MTTLRTPAQLFIAQTKLFQRHCAKHIRIADAALREFDDFLSDKSCGWVANFQMQNVTCCNEGSRPGLNGLKLKGLTSKKQSDRHKMRHRVGREPCLPL